MPYKNISELPDTVKVLPSEAQQQFLRVVNSSLERGDDEETAFTKSWGVIKNAWEQDKEENWVKKMGDMPQLLLEFNETMGDSWRLFMPFKTIHHGVKKEFTLNDGIEMVSNFKQHVPDYDLPINALHRDEFGVYGKIADMRIGTRGVEWQPLFNDGAVVELIKKGYKYASPEVQFDGYTGVFDGKTYKNVALGIAITPRPRLGRDTLVFSDNDDEWQEYNDNSATIVELKALALEYPQLKKSYMDMVARIEALELADNKSETTEKELVMPGDNKELEVQLQEKEVAIVALTEEKVRLEAEKQHLEQQVAQFAEAKAQAEKVAMQERYAKRQLEFAEIAKQISGLPESNFGEELLWLNDSDTTEDKVHYEKFFNVLKALGNQQHTAQLFKEVGHDGTAPVSVDVRFENLVKQAMSEHALDRSAAIQRVVRENAGLYAEYDRAMTKRLSN